MQRTDAADGGCGGGLDFAPMHAVGPSGRFLSMLQASVINHNWSTVTIFLGGREPQ